jgi:DNA-directed RNA polymerase specialized sigma24 family protein
VSPACDSYVLCQTSCRARLLVKTAGFPVHEFDDLCQELRLDLLLRSRKFNPSRGEWPAFVRGITRHHASVLLKRRNRRARREILAAELSDRDGEDQDDPENILESLQPCDGTEALLLSIDVRGVIRKLPPQHQALARLLSIIAVGEVPSALGKSRSRIYQMLRQIRLAFGEAGLGPRSSMRLSDVTTEPTP